MDKKALALPLGTKDYSAISTLCKFQVSGFRSNKKELRDAEVIIASQRKAVKFLKNRPTGSYILRFAKDALWTKKSPLFVSVKFDVQVVHQMFTGIELTMITGGKEEAVTAKLDSKAFKTLGKILEFLPKVQIFAREVVANKNFVEQTLSDSEVAQELEFKDYVVFPNMGAIVIHRRRKNDSEHEDALVARVGIDWDKLSLFSSLQGVISVINDFNEFLLGFLEIRSVDRYEIMGVLGYNPQDMDVASAGQTNRKARASPERPAFAKNTARAAAAAGSSESGTVSATESRSPRSSNEVAKLSKELRDHYAQNESSVPDPPVTLLRAIYRSALSIGVNDMRTKMEWIDGGLFADLCKVICLHSGASNEPKEPIKICKRLLENNPEGSLDMCRNILLHLREHVDCVAIYLMVQHLLSVRAFLKAFLQNRGPHFLMDFYEKTCVILHGRQYDRSLDFTNAEIVDDSLDMALRDKEEVEEDDEPSAEPERSTLLSRISDSRNTKSISGNSETGDDESSASGQAVPAQPPAPVQQVSPRTQQRELEKAIQALEQQRATLGDAKVASSVEFLQRKLQALNQLIKRLDERNALKEAISKLESQRGPLGDETVDMALKPLQDKLSKVEQLLEAEEKKDATGKKSPLQEQSKKKDDNSSRSSSSSSSGGSSSDSSNSESSDDEGQEVKAPVPRTGPSRLSLSRSSGMLRVGMPSLKIGNVPPSAGENEAPTSSSAPKTPVGVPGLLLTKSTASTSSTAAATDSPSPESPWSTSRAAVRANSGSESGSVLKRGGSQYNLFREGIEGSADGADTLKASETAKHRLAALAVKLGETFMASDLTALLKLKKQSTRAGQSDKALQARVEVDEPKPLNRHIVEFRSSKGYLIKTIILGILATVSTDPEAEEYFDAPVNLVLTELVAAKKNRFLHNDEDYRAKLFSVLAPFANKVEAIHRLRWSTLVSQVQQSGMNIYNFRSKLDLFLFRIRAQLMVVSACSTPAECRAVQAYCSLLVDYMRLCFTRVTVPCVIDTCLEPIVSIAKNLFDVEMDVAAFGPDRLRTIVHVLQVFDALGFRSTMGSTTELLVNMLVESDHFWTFMRKFAGDIFLNNDTTAALKDEKRSGIGRELLKQVRRCVIIHFRASVALIKRHYESTKRGYVNSAGVDNSQLIRLLLTKFEFLVVPGAGVIPRFFDMYRSPYDDYHVKIEMLQLLIDLFGFPESPLVTRSVKYVDFYISDAYLSFIKLFNSNDFDDATLNMCRLYIEILIQFSKIKNQSVRMKMSQLRVMDFLANQIDLEYQMTLLTDGAAQAPEKYSSLAAVTDDIAMRRSPRPAPKMGMRQGANSSTGGSGGAAVSVTSTPTSGTAAQPSKTPSPEKTVSTPTLSIGANRMRGHSEDGGVSPGRGGHTRSSPPLPPVVAPNASTPSAPSAAEKVLTQKILTDEHNASDVLTNRTQTSDLMTSRSKTALTSSSSDQSSSSDSSSSDDDSSGGSGSSEEAGEKPLPMGVIRIPRNVGASPAKGASAPQGVSLPSVGGAKKVPAKLVVVLNQVPQKEQAAEEDKKVVDEKAPEEDKADSASASESSSRSSSRSNSSDRSSSSSSSGSSSSGDEGERPLPMGVTRIPRVVKTPAAPAAAKSTSPAPAVKLPSKISEAKVVAAIPVTKSANVSPRPAAASPAVKPPIAALPKPKIAPGSPSVSAPGSPSISSAPPSKTPSFTLRFGEGKVQEWGQRDRGDAPATPVSASATSRHVIDFSSDEQESSSDDEKSPEEEKRDPVDEKKPAVDTTVKDEEDKASSSEASSSKSSSDESSQASSSARSSASSSEGEGEKSPRAMAVIRIPRKAASPSSPIPSTPPKKDAIRAPSLRLAPSITKDGSAHGTGATSVSSTPPAVLELATPEKKGVALHSSTSMPSLKPKVGSPFQPGSLSLALTPAMTKDRSSVVLNNPSGSPSLSSKATSQQLSARYDAPPGMGQRPAANFATVKARPGRESVALTSLFGNGNGAASSSAGESEGSLDASIDSLFHPGLLTSRDLLGDMRGLTGERTKIKSFTRLFSAPLWGEKDDPIKSKLVSVRWAKIKVKELLVSIGKEKDSVAALPGTKSFANPMALKSLQVTGEESSSSEDEVPPPSPSRLKSPLSPKPALAQSPRMSQPPGKTKQGGKPGAVVPSIAVPTKDTKESDGLANVKKSKLSLDRIKDTGLSALQKELWNVDGPNRIEVLAASAKAKEKQKKVDAANLFVQTDEYEHRRSDSKLYASSELHVAVLALLLDLMTTDIGTLDPLYVSQFPVTDKKLNIPFYLRLHLNHPANRGIIPSLVYRMRELGTSQFRLLKLIVTQLFQRSFYKDLEQVAKGAYGIVYKTRVEKDRYVAVKLMSLPNTMFDRCVLHDIFTEVSLLDMYRSDTRSCHLYDYGVDDENYWLVMKWYVCSLRAWRKRQTRPLKENLPLYLNVFMCVLNTMQFLTDHNTNHYDLKCDNFLLQPLHKSIPEDEIYNQPTSTPNFTVALADFGEAKIYPPGPENEALQYTFRNRGTEYIKSPEMLMAAYSKRKEADSFDRRARQGANSASDIWSLGCLFFELLTGEFLFYDDDWVKFFLRVTQGTEVLTAEKRAMLDGNSDLIRFLNFILQRKQQYRPSIQDVIQRFLNLRATLTSKTPRYVPIPPKIPTKPGGPLQQGGSKSVKGPSTPTEPSMFNSPHLTGSATASPLHIPLNEDVYSPEEQAYFMAHPTEILPGVYVSSLFVAANRETVKAKLEITHMVNASSSQDPFPGEFHYLTLEWQDHAQQSILEGLQSFVTFMRQAMEQKGNVLIFSDRGVSRCAALAIAWVMEETGKSFYESFIYVKDRRYVLNPNQGFVRQLMAWRSRDSSEKITFQCHCGACIYGCRMDDPTASKEDDVQFDLEAGTSSIVLSGNILACHCTAAEASMCPVKGCHEWLDFAQTKHSFLADNLMWTFTTKALLQDIQFVTSEVAQPKCRPGWTVFRCKTCEFVTHASFGAGKDTRYALMSNIPVETRTMPRQSFKAPALNPQFRLSEPPTKPKGRTSTKDVTLQTAEKKPPMAPVDPLKLLLK